MTKFEGIEYLNKDYLETRIDEETDVLYVVYKGEINASITAEVYTWQRKYATPEILKQLRGSIYDFRAVTKFIPGNLSTLQHQSRELNDTIEEYYIPVAMLVSNFYQEQMVHISAKLTPNEDRKRIVNTVEEALTFFNEYQQQKH